MRLPSKKIFVFAGILIACIVFFYYFGISDYFTITKLKENHKFLKDFVRMHYLLSVIIYISTYSVLIACALPIVMPMALIGGFLYGLPMGLLYAGLSCLIGSIVTFLALRHLVGHWIRHWHNERIDRFNNQIQKYGYSYLLILHFLSIVPMFVINLLAAMAKVPLFTVIWVTIAGTFPLNFLCVYAGQQLSSIHSFNQIFSPTIIVLLCLLACAACAPLFLKKIKGVLGV